jgi:Fe-S cluster biogenesis protein NfuA
MKSKNENVLQKGGQMKEKVETTLKRIRPSLQADGGDVELVEVSPDGVVKLKLTGACAGCAMSQMTLKMGIEKALKQEVPEVKEVIGV